MVPNHQPVPFLGYVYHKLEFSDLSATGPPVLTMRPTNVPRFTRLQLASQALMTLEMWKTHGKNPWKIIYEW